MSEDQLTETPGAGNTEPTQEQLNAIAQKARLDAINALPSQKAFIHVIAKFLDGTDYQSEPRPVTFKTPESLEGFIISILADARKLGYMIVPSHEGMGIKATPLEAIKDIEIFAEIVEEPQISRDTNVNAASILEKARRAADAGIRNGKLVGFPSKR